MSKKSTKLLDVIVIGAGASGMMAAITAARRGKSVGHAGIEKAAILAGLY